jgi:DNA-binding MarR family transcriptional regulator/DNA-binding response OmpR family regulator
MTAIRMNNEGPFSAPILSEPDSARETIAAARILLRAKMALHASCARQGGFRLKPFIAHVKPDQVRKRINRGVIGGRLCPHDTRPIFSIRSPASNPMSDPLLAPVTDVILDGSVLVVCTDRERLGFYREMLGERGYHIVGEEDPARAVHQLARNRKISVVFLDIGAGTGPWLEGLKTTPQDGVEYVVASDTEEDLAAAPAHAEKLVKPFGRGQLLGAVNSAFNLSRMQRFRLEEMRTLDNSLQEFKARTLAAVSQFMARTQTMRGGGVPETAELAPNSLEALAAEECRRARLRDRIFGPLGLSQASWLLLLVMAEAQWAGAELTVKSAAYSAGLPLSSALRKINEMCAKDLVLKRGDPHDARRSFVTLTPSGQSHLARYLSELNPGERNAASGLT